MKQLEIGTAALTELRLTPAGDGLPSLLQAATDLSHHFNDPANADFGWDFPHMAASFSVPPIALHQALLSRQQAMAKAPDRMLWRLALAPAPEPDAQERYEYAPKSRLHVVGMGILAVSPPHAPRNPQIKADSPNLSLLISEPYRRQGIGKLLANDMLDDIENRFTSRAWAVVRSGNVAAQALAAGLGFIRIGSHLLRGQTVIEYDYEKPEEAVPVAAES
jgi:ribosomal protein S18 acetylase RimI-like enzyme